MPIPESFVDFDVEGSTVTVWLFKKSGGAGGTAPTFTGRWIETDEELDSALKDAVVHERARITEVEEYGILTQTNEVSALRIDLVETHAGLMLDQLSEATANKKIANLKQVQNTAFYVIELENGDDALYAVHKTDSSWQSRAASGIINVLFQNAELGLSPAPGFRLTRDVDFFITGENILIRNKPRFESVLSYKRGHAEDFANLQQEVEFTQMFTTLTPLVTFVGANTMHLRRTSAIRQKGHYKNAAFMARLRQNHAQYGLSLQFDGHGRLVPTPENCADVMRALLDHRLHSPFSHNTYDVPDATVVVAT